LRSTGGLRDGHFVYPDGPACRQVLQVPVTMRHYEHAKILSVGLSRLLRANTEIRAMIPELSIVAPATGGLPVAYGVCEALRAARVYWAEREKPGEKQQFRQFLEVKQSEKVLLVDDILRSGRNLMELKTLVESYGATVVGLAVIVYQPTRIPRISATCPSSISQSWTHLRAEGNATAIRPAKRSKQYASRRLSNSTSRRTRKRGHNASVSV